MGSKAKDALFRDSGPLHSWHAMERSSAMESQCTVKIHPSSEHDLYLKLFITNGGGW
jgi:hypothetical protein